MDVVHEDLCLQHREECGYALGICEVKCVVTCHDATLSEMSSFGKISPGMVPMASMQLVLQTMTTGLKSGLA